MGKAMIRSVILLIFSLALAGVGAIYVWSTINALSLGEAGWGRGLSLIPVIVGMVALLLYVIHIVNRMEEPR